MSWETLDQLGGHVGRTRAGATERGSWVLFKGAANEICGCEGIETV